MFFLKFVHKVAEPVFSVKNVQFGDNVGVPSCNPGSRPFDEVIIVGARQSIRDPRFQRIYILYNTTQSQHNTTQHNTITTQSQHNTTQNNTTQHNTTQRNTTQHNTAQHTANLHTNVNFHIGATDVVNV